MRGLRLAGRLFIWLGVLAAACTDGSNTSAATGADHDLDGGASAALRDAAALDGGQHDAAAFAQGCAELLQHGALGLQAAINAADRSCLVNSDCLRWEPSLRCDPNCDQVFLSDAGLAALQTAMDHANETVCADYQARGCPVARSPPCDDQLSLEPHCSHSMCQ